MAVFSRRDRPSIDPRGLSRHVSGCRRHALDPPARPARPALDDFRNGAASGSYPAMAFTLWAWGFPSTFVYLDRTMTVIHVRSDVAALALRPGPLAGHLGTGTSESHGCCRHEPRSAIKLKSLLASRSCEARPWEEWPSQPHERQHSKSKRGPSQPIDRSTLLVEWSSPWHEFVTSISPALSRSEARLAGESPFGLVPYRIMIPSYIVEAVRDPRHSCHSDQDR